MSIAYNQKLKSWIKLNLPALFIVLKSIYTLITHPHIWFRTYILKNSIFTDECELCMAMGFSKKLIDKSIEFFHPATVLELGCGTGRCLDYLLSKGIDAIGVEGSKIAISKSNHPELIVRHNLEKELNLGKKFDLIWSFEVVEHIHPNYVHNLMKTFLNHSDKIIMSAAPPGQGGDGHFNEQPSSYWIAKFEKYGYQFDENKTNQLREINEPLSENMMVFERR